MKIAIDASPAFRVDRTGIEEYTYQIIKHLRTPLADHRVVLYVRGGTAAHCDFEIPPKWEIREISLPRLWTYIRLSGALFLGRYDRLFVPGHVVPPIHPNQTIAVVHGLEYEMTPKSFSCWERFSMRASVKLSCRWARRIVCVSNNTKKDLQSLYKISPKKMRVIYEGVNPAHEVTYEDVRKVLSQFHLQKGQYIFFVGRIETRKNIIAILQAFDILKEHFHIPHKLVLAGKPGHGYEKIKKEIHDHGHSDDIIVTGFISDIQKWSLLAHAHVFIFPTLYEGFGLPVLEAQQCGVPVVTSNTSSLKEISKESAVTVNPLSPQEIARGVHSLLDDENLYADIAKKGHINLTRFSWERAGKLMAKMILMKK